MDQDPVPLGSSEDHVGLHCCSSHEQCHRCVCEVHIRTAHSFASTLLPCQVFRLKKLDIDPLKSCVSVFLHTKVCRYVKVYNPVSSPVPLSLRPLALSRRAETSPSSPELPGYSHYKHYQTFHVTSIGRQMEETPTTDAPACHWLPGAQSPAGLFRETVQGVSGSS